MSVAIEAFCRAVLFTDSTIYRLIHLPPQAITAGAGVLAEIGAAFSALIVDKDEITLVLPADLWEEFANRLPGHRTAGDYRLITFDLPLDLEIVGFLALVSAVVAESGIPLMAFSSFERDHLLVPANRFQAAWDALHDAQTRLAQK